MDMSLREFIKRQLGGEQADPWVYNNVTALLQRVTQLEQGVGLTVSIPDVIALNIQKDKAFNGMIDNVIIPADGTVQGFFGAATTEHTSVVMRILRTSTVLGDYEFTAQVTSNPQFLSLDISVRGGDVLTFFLEGASPEPPAIETPTPELETQAEGDEEGSAPETPVPETPAKPDFTEVMGAFLIQLPAKTYIGGTV